jgi:hypothetical protein
MLAIIIKYGTHPPFPCFVKNFKRLSDIKVGDRIKFVEQIPGKKRKQRYQLWEGGIVEKIDIDMPIIRIAGL